MKVLFAIIALLAIVEASILVSKIAPLQEVTSCAGRCNQSGTNPGCQCNSYCQQYNDCCADYYELCLGTNPGGSCAGKCDSPNDPGASCQCNKPCVTFGDCCPDYEDVCEVTGGPITNAEIAALTEELYALEGPNNAYRYITVSSMARKGFNTTGDNAIMDLLTVDPAAYELDTVKKLIALFDNYSPAVCTAEIFTSQQEEELNAFVDAVFATPIMQRTQEFLVEKGLPNGKANFVQIWIDQYSRCSGTKGSSGLEHILLGELRSGVSGFHNWVFFAKGEEAGDVVYGSATDFVEFGDKGAAIEFGFTWLGQSKPVSSIYIGTSPELELALTTVAFLARPNAKCPVSLNGTNIQIQTYDITLDGLKYVASGYPDLSN